LVRNGYDVSGVCTNGAQAINMVNELDEGIVFCGYRLSDMYYSELHDYLPKGFQMLLIASATKLDECMNNEIVCLGMPIKTMDLISTIEMMTYNYNRQKKKRKEKPKQRSEEEKETIYKAKTLLMSRNKMTEEEAYRYMQKTSMDNGTNLVETAEMILTLAEL
jgi:two-component system, response regulator PdtaR